MSKKNRETTTPQPTRPTLAALANLLSTHEARLAALESVNDDARVELNAYVKQQREVASDPVTETRSGADYASGLHPTAIAIGATRAIESALVDYRANIKKSLAGKLHEERFGQFCIRVVMEAIDAEPMPWQNRELAGE